MSSPGTSSDADAHANLRTAAEWYAVLQGDANAEEQAQWQRWIDADPAHRLAWERVEAVSRQFGALPAQPALSALSLHRGRRGAGKKLLALVAAGGFGAVAARRESHLYLASLGADERTGIGELRQVALGDGSDLWINTDSALDIDFAAGSCRLELYRGEILLRSQLAAGDATRSIVVDLPVGRLQTWGGRFSVFQDGQAASLAVFEGALQVVTGAGGRARVVAAGRRLRFGAGWMDVVSRADEMQAAWTRRRLSVEDMRLADFVAELGRYWRGRISCHPALADMRLTGNYPLESIDRILAVIEKTLPVRVHRILPWWVMLEPPAASPG